MAMLITKFHRLIQSKLLWLFFLVVIIFSFVIWGTTMPTAEDRAKNAAGQLDGASVSFEDFQRMRFHTYLSIVLMSGRDINITPEVDEELYKMAWQRLATLREAEKLGITATDDEVVRAIQSLEFLQTNGKFNPQAYEGFYQQFLAPRRASKKMFDEHIRQEIVLQKFRVITDRMLLVTPQEIQRTYSTLTDTFTVEYVNLSPAIVSDEVTVSEEDVLAYFSKDPSVFTLAEKVSVKAAVFPIADYAATIEITEAEIKEYYDFNLDKFTTTPDEPATNSFSLAGAVYRPLDEVSGEIRATLTAIEARVKAEQEANRFVQQVSERHAQGRSVFDQIASEFGVELVLPKPFTVAQRPEGLEAGADLVRAAFSLSDDNDYFYSDPIKGSNYVYVLALQERIPERVPEFEEVKNDVTLMAREFAVYNALTEKAQEIRESVVAGLAVGLTFNQVLADYGLSSEKLEPFTISDMKIDEELASNLVRPILVLNQNELTELIQTDDGILLGYVAARTPSADPGGYSAMQQQITSMLRREFSRVAFADLQQHILRQSGFVDNLRRQPAEASQPDENESDQPRS
ncbi:MAG TPA: SurA N-terminal domain-containing protein [Kiritimatiellia bacterium]|nr:SurA N-terminal domain-containing protein [Kiritimatiellia bacterium]HMP34645.1 SurA N-terminal domain-containing protein [Kiritimatiellia bacterium]